MILDKTVPQIKVDEFKAVLMSAYQRAGVLKPAVESKRADAFNDEIGPSGPRADNLMLKPKSWSGGQYLRIFPHGRMHDDDTKDAACSIGQAAACWNDQLILDAPASASIPSTVGALGTDVTYEILAQAIKILIGKGIDPMRNHVCVACPYFWFLKLRKDKRIKWSDCAENQNYSEIISFRIGEKEFSCRIEFIPDYSDTGGFNPARGVGYVFTKDSIILGHVAGLVGDIDWIPQRHSFLATGHMSADAVVQRPEGIVKILGQTS